MTFRNKSTAAGVPSLAAAMLLSLAGCDDKLPTEVRQPETVPEASINSEDSGIPHPPGTMTGTILGGDSMYGWGPVAMEGGFPEATYVEIKIAGLVERWTSGPPIWATSTYVTDVDPAGTGSNCAAAARVQFFVDGKAAGGYSPCDAYSTFPLQEVWSWRGVVNGEGRVSRRSGPTTVFGNCNQPGTAPCYVHHGSQRVTVTPIAASLSVKASRTSIVEGDTVVFTASVSGTSTWQVRDWIWQPDQAQEPALAPPVALRFNMFAESPRSTVQSAQPLLSISPDGRTNTRYVGQTGTMYVRAKVGTRVEQASVRIVVIPDTLELTADPVDAIKGEIVSFTSRTLHGTDYEVIRWGWLPFTQHDSVPRCAAPSKNCHTPVYASGMMFVTAVLTGGREIQAMAGVAVDPNRCITGDPILDSDRIRKAMADAWNRSNPSGSADERKEQGLRIYKDPTTGRYIPIAVEDENATACQIHILGGMPDSMAITDLVALLHTHPNRRYARLPESCGANARAGNPLSNGGGSPRDWAYARQHREYKFYVMEPERVWWMDPTLAPRKRRSTPRWNWNSSDCRW